MEKMNGSKDVKPMSHRLGETAGNITSRYQNCRFLPGKIVFSAAFLAVAATGVGFELCESYVNKRKAARVLGCKPKDVIVKQDLQAVEYYSYNNQTLRKEYNSH